MNDNPRWQRVERLLKELQYEVTRGMLEGEIDETVSYEFVVPVSKVIHHGVVLCRFWTRPRPRYEAFRDEPRLRLVKR